MTREQVLEQARGAAAAGCKEALFTLGDKPERRYKAAREGLAALGHSTTLEYLREAAELVFRETGLLPHLNPGLMDAADFAALRPVSASMGIMLESVVGAADREGWRALRLARQGAGAPPRDAPPRRRGARPVHHRHPDRHRRDARSSASSRCSRSATCTSATATCRRSSSRTSAPSPRRGWPSTRSRRSRICCGRSRWRG